MNIYVLTFFKVSGFSSELVSVRIHSLQTKFLYIPHSEDLFCYTNNQKS